MDAHPSASDAGPSTAVTTTELVSVVVPAYNAARFIGEALRSVLAQVYPAIELIVVNDGSTDHTGDVVRALAPQALLLEQSNRGLAAARNAGVRAARGRYVAFLDADDAWHPSKLEKQLAVLARYPEAGVVTTLCQKIDAQGRALPTQWKRAMSRLCDRVVDLQDELLMRGNVLVVSSAVVRKELLEEAGGFTEEGRMLSEDYDLWLRVAGKTSFYILSEALTDYRVLKASLLHGSLEKEYGTQLDLLRRHQHRYTSLAYRRRLARIHHDWADSAFWQRERDAWRQWRLSLRHDPLAVGTWLLGVRALARSSLMRMGVISSAGESPQEN